MTTGEEDRFSVFQRLLSERREELAARIAELKHRRSTLASGRPITPPDVERAQAAAKDSRERAEQAHRRAAAGYLAAAAAHESAAEAHAGDSDAHRRAAEDDRRRAAEHRRAAQQEDLT